MTQCQHDYDVSVDINFRAVSLLTREFSASRITAQSNDHEVVTFYHVSTVYCNWDAGIMFSICIYIWLVKSCGRVFGNRAINKNIWSRPYLRILQESRAIETERFSRPRIFVY